MPRYIDFNLIGDLVDALGNVYYEDLQNIPTANVKPVVRGKWIKTYRNGFGNLIGYCNQCGWRASVDNFCPNCGADMRGEQNG